jgi:hypothetical protein
VPDVFIPAFGHTLRFRSAVRNSRLASFGMKLRGFTLTYKASPPAQQRQEYNIHFVPLSCTLAGLSLQVIAPTFFFLFPARRHAALSNIIHCIFSLFRLSLIIPQNSYHNILSPDYCSRAKVFTGS